MSLRQEFCRLTIWRVTVRQWLQMLIGVVLGVGGVLLLPLGALMYLASLQALDPEDVAPRWWYLGPWCLGAALIASAVVSTVSFARRLDRWN